MLECVSESGLFSPPRPKQDKDAMSENANQQRTCVVCKYPFAPNTYHQKFCGVRCRQSFYKPRPRNFPPVELSGEYQNKLSDVLARVEAYQNRRKEHQERNVRIIHKRIVEHKTFRQIATEENISRQAAYQIVWSFLQKQTKTQHERWTKNSPSKESLNTKRQWYEELPSSPHRQIHPPRRQRDVVLRKYQMFQAFKTRCLPQAGAGEAGGGADLTQSLVGI